MIFWIEILKLSTLLGESGTRFRGTPADGGALWRAILPQGNNATPEAILVTGPSEQSGGGAPSTRAAKARQGRTGR